MNTRTTHTTVRFTAPFSLSGVDEIQPPGDYAIAEDEELIDGLSWLAYRRVATFIHLPAIPRLTVSEASLWVSTIPNSKMHSGRMRNTRNTPAGGSSNERSSLRHWAVGQTEGEIGMALQTGDMFRITGRMPARNWSGRYRISNNEGRHERVAEENNLEEIAVAASPWSLLGRRESSSPKWPNRQENVHDRVREQRLDRRELACGRGYFQAHLIFQLSG